MDAHSSAIVSLFLVGLGALLILLGAFMSLVDWNSKRGGPSFAPGGLGGSLEGLSKLLDAMKNYPPGQKMIVFGIVILILGGLWGGVTSLGACAK